jgi:glycine dehydrogenase subunit 2
MLIFEKGSRGRHTDYLPECDVECVAVPESDRRTAPLDFPELSENDISRHYSELERKTHGVNDGFYPLGSCTMKYNPKINDRMADLEGFTEIHPLAPESDCQGCLEVMKTLEEDLCEITGMDRFTLQPAAGAHGEFTGLLLIKAYHESRGAGRRKEAYQNYCPGQRPRNQSGKRPHMAGYEVVNIASGPDGCIDLRSAEQSVCDDTVAGLMLTNPNTVGLFDRNIR